MRRRAARVLTLLVAAIVAGATGCHSSKGGAATDAPPGDGNPPTDGPVTQEITCETLPPVDTGSCSVTGDGGSTLLKGEVLAPGTIFHGGQVRYDQTGQIACVGCDCAQGGETVVTCPDAVISPGFINTHDHIEYTDSAPKADTTGERYEDRQQWRNGGAAYENHKKITHSTSLDTGTAAGLAKLQWGELRFLMSGATSVVGSATSAHGLVRNLDYQADEGEGITRPPVDMDTFPLDDLSKGRENGNCDYGPSPTTGAQVATKKAYEPHTSEGIDDYAHNEFACQTSDTFDTSATTAGKEGGKSHDLLLAQTAMIHSIGLTPADYQLMASKNVGLVWSPRSNISLYADTARLPVAARLGVEISLGTDWLPSGSMNMQRELKCADNINTNYFAKFFSDEDLWKMATKNAASITATDDVLGLLKPGYQADISIFNAHGKAPFRAVLDADPQDVVLVMRAGKPLYGDATLIDSLTANCDALDVCSTPKKLCLMSEIGTTYTALSGAVGSDYPLFACGTPTNEPTCTPVRAHADTEDPQTYTGMPSAGDMDGDGIPDATDKCPTMFDPIRPMDHGVEADYDNDGVGDICDPCPANANTTTCAPPDANDRDGDGVTNDIDNCPDTANPGQEDDDQDGKGNACDSCALANPGATACPTTIVDIKNGTIAANSVVEVTHMLVTAKTTTGFFVQEVSGDPGYTSVDYTGLFVYTGPAATGAPLLANVQVGRRVTVDGTVTLFGTAPNAEIELGTVTAVTPASTTDEALPAPVAIATYADIMTGGTRTAKLEGVLVSAGAVTATAYNATYGELTVSDGATPTAHTIIIDDLLFATTHTGVGQKFSTVAGILTLRNDVANIEPRSATDLGLGAAGIASLAPALSYMRAGTSGATFPSATPLMVTLSGPVTAATTVTMSTSDMTNLMVANLVIPLNGTAGAVQFVAPAGAVAGTYTVTAMLGTQMMTAQVRVLGATEAPTKIVSLSPTTAAVTPNGTVPFTVTLDVPTLAVTPVTVSSGSGGSVSACTVAINATTCNFTYTDNGTTSGMTTVTASFGSGADATATVTVNTGADHLVINEIDYDQPMTDTAEFLEIYNPSATAQSLANLTVYVINGSGSGSLHTPGGTIALATAVPGGMLASHHYLVIAGGNVNVTNPNATKYDPGWTMDQLENGGSSPDGAVLVDTSTHTVIDGISYEGGIEALQLPGFTGTVNLVAGGTPMTVSDPGAGSLCRKPNGQDTDVDTVDWALCATTTPGADN